MTSNYHNWGRRRRIMTAMAIAGVFLLSASFAIVFNPQGNSGEQVAEAAGRVNRQVDDTQEAFKEIKDLIPEERRLEAAAPDGYDQQPTSGSLPSQPQLPTPVDDTPVAGKAPLPVADDGYPEGHSYGINPASDGVSASGSVDEDRDGSDRGSDEKNVLPTLTFNQQARDIQGDEVLTQYQEAMDRIVDNWTPQYESAKREHQELVERINATHELWPKYREEQHNLIGNQNNPVLHDIMEQSLMDDIRTYTRWRLKASEVEQRSIEALSKIEDMNTFIVFYKNQADFKAITQYDDLDVPLQVDLLLQSLDAFETETAGLAEAMKSK